MAECDECGKNENMPYECKRCGGTFCVEHRLPESHDCPGLNAWDGSEGGGALGGGPSASAGMDSLGGRNPRQSSGGLSAKLPFDTGQTGLKGYFRNNMTFVFLLAMWLTFVAQWLVIIFSGDGTHDLLFVSSTDHLGAVWTYVTSVFAHAPDNFFHIVLNSIVLYFFGPIVERKLGSKRFTALFLGAGVLASIGSVWIPALVGEWSGGLGASGAILGVMGVLTILNPDLRVMLLFPPIPMPLWVLTALFAGVSIFFVGIGAFGAFGIGHLAHLIGLLAGLAYGQKLKREGMSGPRQLRMGGGPGGPGGGLGGGRRRF